MAAPAPGFEAFHVFSQWLDKEIAAAREVLDADPDDLLKQDKVQTLLQVKKALDDAAKPDYEKGYKNRDNVFALQVALYFIAGSWVGRSAGESPAGAYLDTRQGLKKFGRRDFDKLVKGLTEAAAACGFDTRSLPELPHIDPCGLNI